MSGRLTSEARGSSVGFCLNHSYNGSVDALKLPMRTCDEPDCHVMFRPKLAEHDRCPAHRPLDAKKPHRALKSYDNEAVLRRMNGESPATSHKQRLFRFQQGAPDGR